MKTNLIAAGQVTDKAYPMEEGTRLEELVSKLEKELEQQRKDSDLRHEQITKDFE